MRGFLQWPLSLSGTIFTGQNLHISALPLTNFNLHPWPQSILLRILYTSESHYKLDTSKLIYENNRSSSPLNTETLLYAPGQHRLSRFFSILMMAFHIVYQGSIFSAERKERGQNDADRMSCFLMQTPKTRCKTCRRILPENHKIQLTHSLSWDCQVLI